MAQEHFFDEFDPTLIEPDYDTLKIVGEYYSRYETQNTRARNMVLHGATSEHSKSYLYSRRRKH